MVFLRVLVLCSLSFLSISSQKSDAILTLVKINSRTVLSHQMVYSSVDNKKNQELFLSLSLMILSFASWQNDLNFWCFTLFHTHTVMFVFSSHQLVRLFCLLMFLMPCQGYFDSMSDMSKVLQKGQESVPRPV